MAEIEWRGTNSGDLNDVDNYSPAAFPGAGDTWMFNGKAINAPDTNMGKFSAVLLGPIYVGDDWKLGDIGSSGSPLHTACLKLVCRQQAKTVYYRASASNTTTAIVVNSSTSAETACVLSGSGTVLRAAIAFGKLDATSYTGNSKAYMAYRVRRANTATFKTGSSGVWSNVEMRGGNFIAGRVPNNLYCAGGFAQIPSDAADSSSATPDIFILGGGQVEYSADDDLGDVVIMNGTLDCLGATRAFSIDRVRVWPDGKFLRSDDLVTVNSGAGPDDMTGGDVQI